LHTPHAGRRLQCMCVVCVVPPPSPRLRPAITLPNPAHPFRANCNHPCSSCCRGRLDKLPLDSCRAISQAPRPTLQLSRKVPAARPHRARVDNHHHDRRGGVVAGAAPADPREFRRTRRTLSRCGAMSSPARARWAQACTQVRSSCTIPLPGGGPGDNPRAQPAPHLSSQAPYLFGRWGGAGQSARRGQRWTSW
jgi:hypothetical protein